MSTEKIKGKVKWYSIRKGFGFITPSSENSPTTEDIFFHQTSIVCDAKTKFLEPEYEVEFEVYTDDSGKYKSKNVTQPGGAPCDIPERKNNGRRRGKAGKGGNDRTVTEEGGPKVEGAEAEKDEIKEEGKKNGEKKINKKVKARISKKGKAVVDPGAEIEIKEGENGEDNKMPARGVGGRQPRKRFDDDISEDIKNKMKEKKLDMRQTSLLIVMDKSRLKFGPEGYAALCHADGIMAEGSFACDEGKVTLTWKNMLKFTDGAWKPDDPIANTSSGVLVGSFNWMDDDVEGLKKIETPESLWGEDKIDPADALQSNNFQMRKCFLSKTPANPRNRRRPRPRGGKKVTANNINGKSQGKTENNKKMVNGKTASVAAN